MLTDKSYQRFASFFTLVGSSYRNPVDPGVNLANVATILDIINEDENIDIIVMQMGFFLRKHFPREFESYLDALFSLSNKTKNRW